MATATGIKPVIPNKLGGSKMRTQTDVEKQEIIDRKHDPINNIHDATNRGKALSLLLLSSGDCGSFPIHHQAMMGNLETLCRMFEEIESNVELAIDIRRARAQCNAPG